MKSIKNVFNFVRDIFFMKKLFIVGLFFLLTYSQCSFAQSFEEDLRSSLQTKPKFDFRLDSRSSFISQGGVRVFGFKLGIEYDHKLTFGLGYNQLLSKVKRKQFHHGIEQNSKLKYYYLSPFVDYVFYRDPRWELSIPVQFGIGEAQYQYKLYDRTVSFAKGFMFSYEPAITFQYKFLSYFGAGAGVGYRLMIVNNSKVKEQFTSPVYLFKFKVYFQDLYQDLFLN